MHIEVHGPITEEHIKTKAGADMTLRKQRAFLFCDDLPHPIPFTINCKEGVRYQPGEKYTFSGDCFVTDNYKSLCIADFDFRLVEISKNAKAA